MNEYETVSGDTWDWIAKKVYDDEMKASVLIEANFHLINTVVFSGGIKIVVPEIKPDPINPLPPWRR
jgi:phage tail protein X